MRCAECARAAVALGTRRRQAARGGAVPGLGAALQSGKSAGSRLGGEGSSGEQREASRCVGLPGRVGPGRGALPEPERTARRGGGAGRHGYWPSSGRRVVLRGVLRPLAPLASFSLSRTTSRTLVLAHHGCSRSAGAFLLRTIWP